MNEHEHRWERAVAHVGGEDFPARRCTDCKLLLLEAETEAPLQPEPYPVPCLACYIGGPLGFGKNCGRRRRALAETGTEPACAVCNEPPSERAVLWWGGADWRCHRHMEV